MFLLNARYDTWQLDNILQLHCRVPNCIEEQMKQFENFGEVVGYIIILYSMHITATVLLYTVRIS